MLDNATVSYFQHSLGLRATTGTFFTSNSLVFGTRSKSLEYQGLTYVIADPSGSLSNFALGKCDKVFIFLPRVLEWRRFMSIPWAFIASDQTFKISHAHSSDGIGV